MSLIRELKNPLLLEIAKVVERAGPENLRGAYARIIPSLHPRKPLPFLEVIGLAQRHYRLEEPVGHGRKPVWATCGSFK